MIQPQNVLANLFTKIYRISVHFSAFRGEMGNVVHVLLPWNLQQFVMKLKICSKRCSVRIHGNIDKGFCASFVWVRSVIWEGVKFEHSAFNRAFHSNFLSFNWSSLISTDWSTFVIQLVIVLQIILLITKKNILLLYYYYTDK